MDALPAGGIDYAREKHWTKKFEKELEDLKIEDIGDKNFLSEKALWDALAAQSGLPDQMLKGFMSLAFTGAAKRHLTKVKASTPNGTTSEWWEKMQDTICNASQIATIRAKYNHLKMKPNEKPRNYHLRLEERQDSLPDNYNAAQIRQRFIDGLPAHLTRAATVATGGIYKVVSCMDQLYMQELESQEGQRTSNRTYGAPPNPSRSNYSSRSQRKTYREELGEIDEDQWEEVMEIHSNRQRDNYFRENKGYGDRPGNNRQRTTRPTDKRPENYRMAKHQGTGLSKDSPLGINDATLPQGWSMGLRCFHCGYEGHAARVDGVKCEREPLPGFGRGGANNRRF